MLSPLSGDNIWVPIFTTHLGNAMSSYQKPRATMISFKKKKKKKRLSRKRYYVRNFVTNMLCLTCKAMYGSQTPISDYFASFIRNPLPLFGFDIKVVEAYPCHHYFDA